MNGVVVMENEEDEMAASEGVIRQGFLCPFCMQDLGEISHLQAHVEKYHAESTSSVDPLDHLKGIFDKAKQKILQMDSPFSSLDIAGLSSTLPSVATDAKTVERPILRKKEKSPGRSFFQEAQELGICRSHTDYFLKCRAPCINEAVVQTNNLIIRLDKLINQCPEDIGKRKAFERETVPWTSDGDANACRVCNAKFTLTRRRHHCRLCGKIMCHSCSQFLSFITARKLTNPAFAAQMLDELERTEAGAEVSTRTATPSMAETLRNAVSGESLQSMRRKSEKILSSTLSLMKRDGTEDANEQLRICAVCKGLLETRDRRMDMLASPPMLVLLYDRLCSLFREAHKLAPSYSRMAESLSKGESMYTLELATQLRNKLIHLQQEIDALSVKIENLCGNDESGCASYSREVLLHRNVRLMTVHTLQELITQMSALPSEETYRELQERRRTEIKLQTEYERERNAVTIKSSPSNPLLGQQTRAAPRLRESSSFAGIAKSHGDDGWSPCAPSASHYNPFLDEEVPIDPLQQQVLIIKGYLKQAAEDGRVEEVEILEGNLRDLEAELERRRIALPPDE